MHFARPPDEAQPDAAGDGPPPVALPADARPRVATLFRMQFEPAQGSWVLLFPEGMVKLNTPAAEILMRCDGRRTVDEIVAELEIVFAQGALHGDVAAFLGQALQRGWLQ